jgi:hypothetical protein
VTQGIFLPLNFNSLWYLGLGMLSLILLSFVYLKTKNKRSLLLFLGMVGVGYTIEYFIYVLMESYEYDPRILSRDAYYDNNMGAYASNLLTLPVTAVLIAVFRLNWIWVAIFTGLVVGIEWLFLKVGIYHHNWWRLAYTFIGLPVYYGVAKAWFTRLMHPLKGIPHSVTLYFITWAISTMQFVSISFFNSRYYNLGWFENRSHDTTAFSSLFLMLTSIFFVWALKLKWKYSWPKYILSVAVVFGVNKILEILGVLHSLVWWDFLYCNGVNFIILIVADIISKRLWNGPIEKSTD